MDIRDALGSRPDTEHGLLVAYGQFASENGLLERLMAVPVPARTRVHKPQAKIVEFLVGILSGIEYLRDLDLSARPLTKDLAVAAAWGETRFAHYSGVSRTLDAANQETVTAVDSALRAFSQPFIDEALADALRRGEPLVLDADLTGQAVSSTSRSYPGAAFGWMDDEVKLGYQLARISVETRRFGRLWLAGFHHPGDTVSVSCLKELVEAAERVSGLRPRRRTELVQRRLNWLAERLARFEELAARQEAEINVLTARLDWLVIRLTLAAWRLGEIDAPLLPNCLALAAPALGKLSQARSRLEKQRVSWQGKEQRLRAELQKARSVEARHRAEAELIRQEMATLSLWRDQLEAENLANPNSPTCLLRLDAGFPSGPNLTWLIELGYQVYTRAISDQTTKALLARVTPDIPWVRVGANAEVVTFESYQPHGCPYPLRAALERFKTGASVKHGTLLEYRDDGKTLTPPAWFEFYNQRQTIEAGNKESKTVFRVQHLMSRATAGVALQARFTTFVSNFVRFAADWLRSRIESSGRRLVKLLSSVKGLTRVAANSPAYIDRCGGGYSLQFTGRSSLPDAVIHLSTPFARQLALPIDQSVRIGSP
jgi:Transposase DDE domain